MGFCLGRSGYNGYPYLFGIEGLLEGREAINGVIVIKRVSNFV